jgi:Na+/H+ antiporter NhaD/arsenite permease-like protein
MSRTAAAALSAATAALLLPGSAQAAGGQLAHDLPVWAAAPFAVLLLCIALLPLVAEHWWERNQNKAIVAAVIAVPFLGWLVSTFGYAALPDLGHAAMEYVSFLSLIGALFVLSGGIFIRGSLGGTPLGNTGLMAFGAVIANVVGTTGASMLLLRPLLRANRQRQRKTHIVVFFIFIVSNCGGLLTPLGDPPLYLGFLKGVPFEWTLQLWKEWALVNGILLLVFNFIDQSVLAKEEASSSKRHIFEELQHHQKLGVEGLPSALLLAGVVLAVLGKGQGWFYGGEPWPFGVQESILILLAFVGYRITAPELRKKNEFSFGPIIEVAVVFAGIFATMVAPLALLNAHGKELGLEHPWHYFWATGLLSSFLDNAPTYLAFASAAAGQAGIAAEGRYLGELLASGGEAEAIMLAISCGAVMMGANTYIGNGPNFMVKAMAEQHGVKMPSFFGYMLWSGAVLIPTFVVVSLVFFKP